MFYENIARENQLANFKISELVVPLKKTLKQDDSLWGAVQQLLKNGLSSLPVLDDDDKLIGAVGYREICKMSFSSQNAQTKVQECMQKKPGNVVQADTYLDDIVFPENQDVLFVCQKEQFLGVVRMTALLETYRSHMTMLRRFEKLSREYECILNNCGESLMYTDGQGNILWMNEANSRLCKEIDTLKACNVIDLERQKIFYPSIVRMVIEERRQKTFIQRSSSGDYVIVTGTPVFGVSGKIDRVVTINRNVAELLLQLRPYLGDGETEQNETAARFVSELETACLKAEKIYSELKIFRADSVQDREIIKCPSSQMQTVMQRVERIARVDSVVLLLGESGVGKDVYANAIHQKSNRRDGPFISVNCGAIPENLLESELFGYEPGAFTGAGNKRKLGLFEVANGGTLFLDEVAELPLALQVKLLHVLQNRTFIRVGGTKPVGIDVRIIAATNKNLSEMAKSGTFREDLYYRLNVVPIEIPPLRARKEDIPTFVLHFLDTFNRKYQCTRQISSEVMSIFLRYDWPGNIREVENLMERLVVIGDMDIIYPCELPQNILSDNVFTDSGEEGEKQLTLDAAIQQFEAQLIQETYKKYKSTKKVAEVLGVDRTTITRKMKKAQEKSVQ